MFLSDTFKRQIGQGKVLEVLDIGAKVRYAEFQFVVPEDAEVKQLELLRMPAGLTKILGSCSLLIFEGKLPDKLKMSVGFRAYRDLNSGPVKEQPEALDSEVLVKPVMRLGTSETLGAHTLASREPVDLFVTFSAPLPAGTRVAGYIQYLRD